MRLHTQYIHTWKESSGQLYFGPCFELVAEGRMHSTWSNRSSVGVVSRTYLSVQSWTVYPFWEWSSIHKYCRDLSLTHYTDSHYGMSDHKPYTMFWPCQACPNIVSMAQTCLNSYCFGGGWFLSAAQSIINHAKTNSFFAFSLANGTHHLKILIM